MGVEGLSSPDAASRAREAVRLRVVDVGETSDPRWRVAPCDPLAASELGRALGLSPTIAQVLLHRGMSDQALAREFLEPKLSGLTSPDAMVDRALAADRIAHAIRRRETIAIFGDYDVDGTTSTAILADAIEMFGGRVLTFVANRFAGGYGFSGAALDRIREANPSLLITCDCGSSDHERIEAARRAGLDVVVVDHHLVPKEPLPALAFLNPHRPDCGFPYKGLASAGLALSLAAAVRATLQAPIDLRPLLDLVALGTIADVAPLDGDNRRLVRAGLAKLAQEEARPGLVALRECAGVRVGMPLGAIDVAFRLAPRLNAAGRLADPQLTVALLRARTLEAARAHAAAIEALNEERKAITRSITEAAMAQARAVYANFDGGVVVAADGWHRGVVGIVAARLVELLDAPVLVVGIENGIAHGSGRAPGGFPLYEAVSRCGSDLLAFGGHQAAIGLTVAADRIEALRAGFDDASRAIRQAEGNLRSSKPIDVALGDGPFSLPCASELAALEPLGAGNSEPTFLVPDALVEDASVVGDNHLKLTLRIGRRRLPCFGYDLGQLLDDLGRTASVVGTLRPDGYRGGENVELRLKALL